MTRTAASITAQVAAEAIINAEEGYEVETMNAVLEVARREGVGSLYIGMLEEASDHQATPEGRCPLPAGGPIRGPHRGVGGSTGEVVCQHTHEAGGPIQGVWPGAHYGIGSGVWGAG